GLDDVLYLDHVVLEGWVDGALVAATLATDAFTACDLGDWAATGDVPGCPVASGALTGQDALTADGSAWTIAQTFDASTICEDLTVAFRYGGEAATALDTALLSFDPGSGSATPWGAVGQPDAAGVLRTFSVNLSQQDRD